MKISYAIRPALQTDAPGLAALLREMGWFSALESFSMDELVALVERHLAHNLTDAGHAVYVAAGQADALLGYASVHWIYDLFMPGPEGYLSELFIQSSARGQGIGAALLDRVRADALERGAYRLSLLNGKHRESYERGFYQKNGWEERSHMANFVYWVQAH